MNNEFYVYVYYKPNGTPFYVGKGKGKRYLSHLQEAKKEITSDCNRLKISTIRKILRSGQEPIIKVINVNLEENNAFELEEYLISTIGRIDLGTGPLTNLTKGGDGTSGHTHTEESKLKISNALLGVPKPDSQKEKLRELLLSGNHPIFSEESRNKNKGENHWAFGLTGQDHPSYGRKDTTEMIEIKRQRMLGRKMGPCSDERRENIRNATKGVKKSTTINMCKPRSKVTCPHCNKEGGSNTMHRWHFDNCKLKENTDVSE